MKARMTYVLPLALSLSPMGMLTVSSGGGLTAGIASAEAAEDGPGSARVREVNASLETLLRKNPAPGSAEEKAVTAQIEKTVDAFLDIGALGQSALVDHWAKLTKAEQTEFSKLLAALVRDSYVRALRSNLDYAVKYVGEKPQGEHLLVSTEVSAVSSGRTQVIAVDYVLRQRGGTWRAVDVITDGVGIVENYRAQFNKIIAKEGFSGLLTRMRKKLDAA